MGHLPENLCNLLLFGQKHCPLTIRAATVLSRHRQSVSRGLIEMLVERPETRESSNSISRAEYAQHGDARLANDSITAAVFPQMAAGGKVPDDQNVSPGFGRSSV